MIWRSWRELAPVSIVAHSLGGNTASRYAGIYLDAVRRLVSIEGIGRPAAAPANDRFSIAAFVKSNLTSFRFFSRVVGSALADDVPGARASLRGRHLAAS